MTSTETLKILQNLKPLKTLKTGILSFRSLFLGSVFRDSKNYENSKLYADSETLKSLKTMQTVKLMKL